ncbi:MAG TPA: mitochondrial fission ELM1 family protein [Candidatus Saccharimonadia bacterium]|nr:mitochondrial fission ELM1 family protein [Candidatus Saccharimonadia bacterium]
MEPISTLVVTDGAAGNERQALALAAAMGLAPRVHRIGLLPPWSWLAPHLRIGGWHALPRALRDPVDAEPPQLAIGCGRTGALATALIRARHGSYAVQILDPRASLDAWDLVVAPAHDALAGDNVVTTIGALNSITPARLAAAALEHAELAQLPQPRTAVLVGGSTSTVRVDAGYAADLLQRLSRWRAREGGSFLVTTSRRTSPGVAETLRATASESDRIYSGEHEHANPYLGFLAHADRIVVTPDSVNLISEACATGKPVYCLVREPVRGKLAAFHRALLDTGRLRPLDFEAPPWTPVPLRETDAVAEQVWRRFRARARS